MRKLASLHDEMVYLQLSGCSFNDLLLDTVLRDESVDGDISLLADSVGSVHGLQVDLRVPVRVKHDHDVGCMQVDAQSTSPGREDEDLLVTVRLLEIIDSGVSIKLRGLPVESAVLVASDAKEIIQDIHEFSHLREDKDLVVL